MQPTTTEKSAFRINVLRLTCRILGILFAVGVLLRHFIVPAPMRVIVLAMSMGLLLLTIDFGLKLKPQWLRGFSAFFFLIFLNSIVAISLLGIGFAAPVLGLLSISPVFASLLLGHRGGVLMFFCALIALFLVYWLDSSQSIVISAISLRDLYKAKIIVMPIILIAALAVAYAYEVNRKKKEEALNSALQEKENLLKEKQQSEFLLNQTGEIAKIGGWSLDLQTQKLWWSEQTYRIHEIPIGEPIQIDAAIDFYAKEVRQTISEAIEEGIASKTGWDLELPFITAQKRRIWVRAVGRYYKNRQGNETLRGTIQDITDKKHNEFRLQRAHDKALQAAAAKSRFLANMSHEIRTPMNGVLGNAEILAEENLTVQQKRHVAIIIESGKSMLQILNDILDFSKIDAGHIEISLQSFDLHHLLQSTHQLFKANAEEKNIKLHLKLDPETPQWVVADPTRLKQILSNLLSNSIKFSAEGDINLSIEVLEKKLSDFKLLFMIKDQGIGVAENMQQKIFEEFTQADLSTTKNFGGTGLGLAICQRLAGAMGSEIKVKSSPNKGATFYFELEIKSAPPLREEKQRKQKTHAINLDEFPESRILVVEDNAINRELALKLLSRFKITAKVACNGQEAVESVQTEDFDLIFMDCQMPIMDGYEATKIIRKTESNHQSIIVAMTANAMTGDKEKCLSIGMNDYIAKPISKKKLLEILQKHLLEKNEIS